MCCKVSLLLRIILTILLKLMKLKSIILLLFILFSRECINRVCEAAGLKSADKKRRVKHVNIYNISIQQKILYIILFIFNQFFNRLIEKFYEQLLTNHVWIMLDQISI